MCRQAGYSQGLNVFNTFELKTKQTTSNDQQQHPKHTTTKESRSWSKKNRRNKMEQGDYLFESSEVRRGASRAAIPHSNDDSNPERRDGSCWVGQLVATLENSLFFRDEQEENQRKDLDGSPTTDEKKKVFPKKNRPTKFLTPKTLQNFLNP